MIYGRQTINRSAIKDKKYNDKMQNNIIYHLKLNYIATFSRQDFKILGIDYGTRKIGAALFHSSINHVIPLGVIIKTQPSLVLITRLIQEYNCIAVVMGITQNSHIAKNVLKLLKDVETNLSIPVLLVDESLTTFAANEILKDIGIKKANRHKIDDAIAAKLILESFICDLRQYIDTK